MVVGPVDRFMPAAVVLGRMLVAVSLGCEVEPSYIVPNSVSTDEEPLIYAVPSVRQKTRASSVATLLHVGHRFMSSSDQAFHLLFLIS